MLRWGLVPHWATDLKIGASMINARSETVAEKPSFRAAFKQRRCVILADGFFEWKKLPDGKQPFYIYRRASDSRLGGEVKASSRPENASAAIGELNEPFCFAGLWESWRDPDTKANNDSATTAIGTAENGTVETCTILTTGANSTMQDLHDRMPVILSGPARDVWLDRSITDRETLQSLLLPCPADWLAMYPVSRSVNKPSYDQPECVTPVEM